MFFFSISSLLEVGISFLKFALKEREKENFSLLMEKTKFEGDHLSIWVGGERCSSGYIIIQF